MSAASKRARARSVHHAVDTGATDDNGTAGRRFVVKRRDTSSDAIVEYGRYSDRREANRHCSLLRWAGAVAYVEELAP